MMAYQNGYVLSIKDDKNNFIREKNVKGERQVYVPFGTEYSIYLKNKNLSQKAKFQIKIDGKLTCPKDTCYVIQPNSTFDLKRFMLDGDSEKGEKFKFVDVKESGEEPGEADNGLIEVIIKEEKLSKQPFSYKYTSNEVTLDNLTAEIKEGVTVGGSESNQTFQDTDDFSTDKEITLKIRLKPTKSKKVAIGACPGCEGSRVQRRNDGVRITCPVCNGSGVF